MMENNSSPMRGLAGRVFRWSIGLALVMALGVGGFLGWQYFSLKSQFAETIVRNPEKTALAVYTFNELGEPIADGRTLYHNADTPMVMASTMKVAVLAAYASAVSSGELDPQQEIPVAAWEAFYLPNTDSGAHAAALTSLELEVGELGFANQLSATVPLEAIARAMIHFSDNAATDYLLTRLGKARISSTLRAAGMERHTPLYPILGVALAAFNHEGQLTTEAFDSLRAELAAGDTSTFEALVDRYQDDPDWRGAQIKFMTDPGGAPAPVQDAASALAYQMAVSELLPRGTAREYARLMAQVASGRLFSPQASTIMQDILETNPAENWLRLLFHDRFGAKPGLTTGVLTCATYANPKWGPLAGQSRVAVILTNRMPLDFLQDQVPYDGHYLLQTDLAAGTGVFARLQSASLRQ